MKKRPTSDLAILADYILDPRNHLVVVKVQGQTRVLCRLHVKKFRLLHMKVDVLESSYTGHRARCIECLTEGL